MSFIFSVKDTYRQAVESATGGKNTVLYDDKGNPSIMVVVPRFDLSDVLSGAPSDPHPAFVVDSQVKSEIFVAKYQCIIHDSRAYSLPHQDPRTSVNFDTSRDSCFAKGNGWHLMTNAEWSALALWCLANGFQPRGNTNSGQSHEAVYERGAHPPTHSNRVATGSGPASWAHTGANEGIFDLCGNIWEWVDGLKTIDGLIWVHPDNDFWRGNGENDTTDWQDTERYMDAVGGNIQINDQRTTEVTDEDPWVDTGFKDVVAAGGVTIPDVLKHLAIFPPDDTSDIGGDRVYMRNEGERVARRGGGWADGSNAGVFALYLVGPRSSTGAGTGFRAAFIPV